MDIHNLEIPINLFLQSLGHWLDLPMQLASFLGTEDFFLLAMPALYWCLGPALGLRVGFALLFNSSFNGGLKIIFGSPRPYWINPAVQALGVEHTFGLPSNHAQSAVVLWGLIAASFRRKWGYLLAGLLMFLIGLSRVYLGVHFTSDVLLGWALGGLLLLLILRLDQPVAGWIARQSLRNLILAAGLGALALLVLAGLPGLLLDGRALPAEWAANAAAAGSTEALDPYKIDGAFSFAGTFFGLFAGAAWLERRRGGWCASGAPRQFIARILIGLVGVLLIWYGLGKVLPRDTDALSYALRFARYALVGAWVSLFAPLIFKRLRLCA